AKLVPGREPLPPAVPEWNHLIATTTTTMSGGGSAPFGGTVSGAFPTIKVNGHAFSTAPLSTADVFRATLPADAQAPYDAALKGHAQAWVAYLDSHTAVMQQWTHFMEQHGAKPAALDAALDAERQTMPATP